MKMDLSMLLSERVVMLRMDVCILSIFRRISSSWMKNVMEVCDV